MKAESDLLKILIVKQSHSKIKRLSGKLKKKKRSYLYPVYYYF